MDTRNSIVQELNFPDLKERGIHIHVKRDDLIDTIVSGNKWRKLKYSIKLAQSKGNDGILTFGGAYSNHLVATAATCHNFGLRAVGIVRGDELTSESNQTLKKCHELGMELVFVDRMTYALKEERAYLEELLIQHANLHIVPEGGADYYGMIGCQEILAELEDPYDQIWVASGTGTTAAGILMAIETPTELNAVSVLKGFDLQSTIRSLYMRSAYSQEFTDDRMRLLKVHDDYHFGGYAKYDENLLNFIQQIYRDHQLPLDPVYTGKTFYAMIDHLRTSMQADQRVLFIHTGGIQGAKSIENKAGITLYS